MPTKNDIKPLLGSAELVEKGQIVAGLVNLQGFIQRAVCYEVAVNQKSVNPLLLQPGDIISLPFDTLTTPKNVGLVVDSITTVGPDTFLNVVYLSLENSVNASINVNDLKAFGLPTYALLYDIQNPSVAFYLQAFQQLIQALRYLNCVYADKLAKCQRKKKH
jgi:hypothetical protein